MPLLPQCLVVRDVERGTVFEHVVYFAARIRDLRTYTLGDTVAGEVREYLDDLGVSD